MKIRSASRLPRYSHLDLKAIHKLRMLCQERAKGYGYTTLVAAILGDREYETKSIRQMDRLIHFIRSLERLEGSLRPGSGRLQFKTK